MKFTEWYINSQWSGAGKDAAEIASTAWNAALDLAIERIKREERKKWNANLHALTDGGELKPFDSNACIEEIDLLKA